jgi:hypothetical protein
MVYVFKVGIIRINFNFLIIKINILFFWISDPIFWQVFCCLHFPLNFHYFSIFFPTKIANLRKFKTEKNMLVRGKGFNPTI